MPTCRHSTLLVYILVDVKLYCVWGEYVASTQIIYFDSNFHTFFEKIEHTKMLTGHGPDPDLCLTNPDPALMGLISSS